MSTGRLGAGDTAVQPTIFDAKGDLLAGSAADTVSRLAVGSNGTVLTADSAEATGLKWAAASGGASNWTQVATSSASGSTITFSGFSGYNSLMLEIDGVVMSSGSSVVLHFRPNNISTSSYKATYTYVLGSSTFGDTNTTSSMDPIFYGSSTGGRTLYGYYVITGCNSTGKKLYWGQGSHNDSSGTYGSRANSIVNGYLTETNAITSFVITTSGGFSSGNFTLWGSTN